MLDALDRVEATADAGRGSPDDDVLVLVEKGSHALSFYDTGTGRRVGTVELPAFPHEMVVDSRRRLAYVGHYGVRMSSDSGAGGSAVCVVDLVARELVRTIDTQPFHRIHGVRLDSEDRLWALSESSAVLLGFDEPERDTAPSRAVPTGGVKTHLFSLTRDGSRAYVTGLLSHTVSLVRPQDPTAGPELMNPGLMPEGSCLSQDERTLYVGSRRSAELVAVDADTLEVRESVSVEGDPLRVYTVSDDELLMTDVAGNSVLLLTGDLRPIERIPLSGPPSAVSFHPDQPIAYISQMGDNRISVLDLEAREIVGGFPTRTEPDCSALLPRQRG
ncbi:hypothetical protein C1701_24190 [Actinoalloteichus sp. AHMU CJ021]|uniref:40-residue YVTN family beta-propeller repeat-containing protein n=3 Tax=Actinoalloteichus cyanogriseus TaxID=2893586 RepID=A0ABT1JCZ9_ACTCY|nr:hypothetical protein [Actinoalloteichus caeruleus]AUS80924.1 hypothetical protein C1701_24190 [Actinoalloteichus sp. AHMU CJ021]MCP2330366.1 40-residue YVTN family beta-propeller repeat-containing protein [Actinoalloteichus caeruleus DSM 43889]